MLEDLDGALETSWSLQQQTQTGDGVSAAPLQPLKGPGQVIPLIPTGQPRLSIQLRRNARQSPSLQLRFTEQGSGMQLWDVWAGTSGIR